MWSPGPRDGWSPGYTASRDGLWAPCCCLSGKGYDTSAAGLRLSPDWSLGIREQGSQVPEGLAFLSSILAGLALRALRKQRAGGVWEGGGDRRKTGKKGKASSEP